jgi:ParB family chromosome partitioning protein
MRKQFPAESLRELADSIREHGLLQPVLVRRLPDGYELIAGERRWRAARLAGVERIPAIVRREAQAEQSLLLGLIENLQREDLDPIEEARGIRRLVDQFGLTHEEAAARLGKHRVAVSQALRLLSACPAVVSSTAARAITAGHARALVGLPTPEAQEQGLKVVLGRRLSVRDTEKWVRDYQPAQPKRRPQTAQAAQKGGDMEEVLGRLQERYGDAVTVRGNSSRGEVILRYSNSRELQELLDFLLT